jgi:hypothetical protein
MMPGVPAGGGFTGRAAKVSDLRMSPLVRRRILDLGAAWRAKDWR